MLRSNRIKKRLLIFLLIPVFIVLTILADDIVIKVITSALLLVYIGFIIFLRDSVKIEAAPYRNLSDDLDDESSTAGNTLIKDSESEFKIISSVSKIEAARIESVGAGRTSIKQEYYRPPELKQNYMEIAKTSIPENTGHNELFLFILQKMLTTIKETFLCHSALFFLYDKNKNRLGLEAFVSISNDVKKQKYNIENDILSKIIINECPELISKININAETDTIRYYNTAQGITSFLGVPVFFNNTIMGVLAIDSREPDAFGVESNYTLGNFAGVLSIIMSLIDDRFKESMSEKRIKSLLGILSGDKKFNSEKELSEAIKTAMPGLIEWDVMTFVYYDPILQIFKTSCVSNKTNLKYIGENLVIELDDTLTGKCIRNGDAVSVKDISASEMSRFSKSEDIRLDGSFLAIPLIYDDQSFGVICFENMKKSFYNNSDIKFLKSAVRIFSFILFSYSSQALLRGLLTVDPETRVLNADAFLNLLSGDYLKAKEGNLPICVGLLRIDNFLDEDSLFESNPFPIVVQAILKAIKEEMSQIQSIGRISDRVFGITFFNSSSKEAFLWSEKLRVKIARMQIITVTKQDTYTVSIGVAGAGNRSTVEELMKNAELALKKACEKNGNSVKSIN